MATRRKPVTKKVDPDRPQIDFTKGKLRIIQTAKAELLAEGWTPPPVTGTLADQLEQDYPELQYTVSQLIPAGTNVLVNAQYKKGKTTAALNLVRSLVDGTKLFDAFPVDCVGNVAWWNCEVGESQAVGWLRDMKIENPERVIPLHLRGRFMPLRDKAVRAWCVRWLRRYKVKVWVVDPFGALYDGEENSNSEIREWLRALDEIKRRAGVSELILVAHTGHDAQDDDAVVRARGGARLMDWPDVIWTYRAGNDDDPNKRYLTAMGRDVSVPEMVLDFEPSTRSLFRVNGVRGRSEDRKVSLAVRAAKAVQRHFEDTGEPMNKTALEEALTGKADVKRRAIAYAVNMQWIVLEHGPNKAQLHTPGDEPERMNGMGVVMRGEGDE